MNASRSAIDAPFLPRLFAAVLIVILAAGGVAGCGDDETGPIGPGNTTTTGFTGLFATGTTSGKVTITINGGTLAGPFPGHRAPQVGTHAVAASAVITPSTGPGTALSGTYSDENDSLYLAGGGYELIAHYNDSADPPSISGSLSGPGGYAVIFCILGASSTIKVYCGTYESATTAANGTWSMVTIDTVLVGLAFPSAGDPSDLIGFGGSVASTGATRAIEFVGGEPLYLELTGSGSLDTATNNVSGTWALDDVSDVLDDAGTWTGSLRP